MGRRGPKPVDLGLLQLWECTWWRAFRLLRDGRSREFFFSYKMNWKTDPRNKRVEIGTRRRGQSHWRQQIFARSDLWSGLLRARSVEGVVSVCRRWQNWLDELMHKAKGPMEVVAFPAPDHIRQHVREFLAAKRDRRFPRRRASADNARLDFLARAMAGVVAGRSPATGVDRLSRIKHDLENKQHAKHCWRCNMERVRRFKQSELYRAMMRAGLAVERIQIEKDIEDLKWFLENQSKEKLK